MKANSARLWLIRWMYVIAFGHFVGGVLLAWFSSSSIFGPYHHTLTALHGSAAVSAPSVHQWWLSLFGATLQNLAVFMGVLTYIGNKYRNSKVWLWMIIGLAIWAPQDMLISLQIDLWLHVWVDAVAVIMMLPALIILWLIDRNISR